MTTPRLLLAGCAAATLLLSSCTETTSDTVDTEVVVAPPLPVSAIRVGAGTIEEVLRAQGRLEARSSIDISLLADGVISELPISDGEQVTQGSLLIALDPLPEHEREQLEAELELSRAQRQLGRVEAVLKRAPGALATSELDEAKDSVADAELVLAQLAKEQQRRRVSAPFDGALTNMELVAGQQVRSGDVLGRLHDMTAFDLPLDLPETTLARLGVGQVVRVSPLAGTSAEGRVHSLPASIDPDSGTGVVRIRVDDPPADWRPGAYAVAECRLDAIDGDVLVPRAAVGYKRNRPYVWEVYRNEAEADRLEVRRAWVGLGAGDQESVIITKGLDLSAMVVIDGTAGLSDGLIVSLTSNADGAGDEDPETAPKRDPSAEKPGPGKRPGGGKRP
jgi:membrane fusion protein (multidrug efflux system)